MITTIKLINISTTSHNYPHLLVVRTLKTHILSKFPVYNTLLLTVVTILYIRAPGLTHLVFLYQNATSLLTYLGYTDNEKLENLHLG